MREMAVDQREFAVRFGGARPGFAGAIERRDEARAIGPRLAMDQKRLWRLAHEVEDLVDLLAGHKALRRQRVIEMREAEFARRRDLVVVPGHPDMRAAQIEDRLDR